MLPSFVCAYTKQSAALLGGDMNAKIYLTIVAVLGVLYGLGFLLIPGNMVALYGMTPGPQVDVNIQFFGAALISIGVIAWFAKDFRDWDAVRGVLIGNAVGDVVGLIVNILAMMQGVLNGFAWSTNVVYIVLLLGALYCLSAGARKTA
jgi:hypothetical protein